MQLYATATSERASKGQGGNKYVNVTLTVLVDGKQVEMGIVSLFKEDDDYVLTYSSGPARQVTDEIDRFKTKGNKQEGEKCMYDHDHSNGGCVSHD